MTQQKKIPKFKSREEFGTFWDTHDLTDYIDQTEKVDELFVLAPELSQRIRERSKKQMVALRLEKWQIERARTLAKKSHVPYQSIIRRWVGQGISADSSSQLPKAA